MHGPLPLATTQLQPDARGFLVRETGLVNHTCEKVLLDGLQLGRLTRSRPARAVQPHI